MYVEMRGREGSQHSFPGVIESALEQCLAMTSLTHAFVAVVRPRQGRPTLTIRALASAGEQRRGWRLSPGMRWVLHTVIESASPVITTGRRRSRAEAHPPVLIATPIMSGERCRAVFAATGHIPPPYAATLQSMRRFARMLNVGELIADPTSPQSVDVMRSTSERHDTLLHELRVPLSAARLLLERLACQRSEGIGANASSDLAGDALRAIEEAQSIVRHFSQLQALNQDNFAVTLRPLNVQAIIERAIALLPGAQDRLRHIAPGSLPEITADPLWLTHVLTNLLENAIIHSPPPYVTDVGATLSLDRNWVMIAITSYGAVIPPANQTSVLLPYRRRDSRDDLTSKGLGLSIARRLVTAMHGHIRMQSDGERSTTISVALPIARE